MPGCILRVSGESFQVDAFLADSVLSPYRVQRRGETGPRGKCHAEGAFHLDVSKADGDLAAQVADAIVFLASHETELQRLRDFPGVTDLRLDFGCHRHDVAAQHDYLPPALLALAGGLGIGIELSHYAVAE